jgi:hypothetical protein
VEQLVRSSQSCLRYLGHNDPSHYPGQNPDRVLTFDPVSLPIDARGLKIQGEG